MPPAGQRAAPGDPLRQALLGQFAEELHRAETRGEATRRITTLLPDLTLEEAQEIRRLGDGLRMDDDAVPVGRHVSFARRGDLIDRGLHHPRWGYAFSNQVFESRQVIDLGRLTAPRFTTALAFITNRDITETDQQAVLESIATIHPAMLLLDSRVGAWGLSTAEIIADNGLLAGFALGPAAAEITVDQLHLFTARITRPTRESVTELGRASEFRGGAAELITWLAAEAMSVGEPLRAGETIMICPLTTPTPIKSHGEYIAEFAGFGRDLLLVSLVAR